MEEGIYCPQYVFPKQLWYFSRLNKKWNLSRRKGSSWPAYSVTVVSRTCKQRAAPKIYCSTILMEPELIFNFTMRIILDIVIVDGALERSSDCLRAFLSAPSPCFVWITACCFERCLQGLVGLVLKFQTWFSVSQPHPYFNPKAFSILCTPYLMQHSLCVLSCCFSDCAVNVHKSCKSLLGECTSSKNKVNTTVEHRKTSLQWSHLSTFKVYSVLLFCLY